MQRIWLPALESIEAELVFADFDQAERRLERRQEGKAAPPTSSARRSRKCLKWLEEGKPLRLLEMTAQELTVFASFGFLSRKPVLVVINCEIERAGRRYHAKPSASAVTARGIEVFRLAAAFESELWELDPAGQRRC